MERHHQCRALFRSGDKSHRIFVPRGTVPLQACPKARPEENGKIRRKQGPRLLGAEKSTERRAVLLVMAPRPHHVQISGAHAAFVVAAFQGHRQQDGKKSPRFVLFREFRGRFLQKSISLGAPTGKIIGQTAEIHAGRGIFLQAHSKNKNLF